MVDDQHIGDDYIPGDYMIIGGETQNWELKIDKNQIIQSLQNLVFEKIFFEHESNNFNYSYAAKGQTFEFEGYFLFQEYSFNEPNSQLFDLCCIN